MRVVKEIASWPSRDKNVNHENTVGFFRLENLSSEVLPRVGETVQIPAKQYPNVDKAVHTDHTGNGVVYQVEHRLGDIPIVTIAGKRKLSTKKLGELKLPNWPLG